MHLNEQQLVCHPDFQNLAIQSISVTVDKISSSSILLSYQLIGELKHLIMPKPQAPAPADKLWQHSCFELFVAIQNQPGYLEFNFSPSGLWAAYAFSDYRKLEHWTIDIAPIIATEIVDNTFTLTALIESNSFPINPNQVAYQLGLTAVIEDHQHSCSYWALQHPSEQPDFHHRDGFACILENL